MNRLILKGLLNGFHTFGSSDFEGISILNFIEDNHKIAKDLDVNIQLAGVDEKNLQVSYEDERIYIDAKDYTGEEITNGLYVGKLNTNTLKAKLENGILHLTGKLKSDKINVKIN